MRNLPIATVSVGVCRKAEYMESSVLKTSALGLPGRRGPSPLLRLAPDERLIALVRRGQQAAFETIVSRYQARLLAFCRHMLASREDAEDVLQEVFAAAFNAILADQREINVRPWLYRIARNRCLNHLRRQTAIGVDSMDVHFADAGQSTVEKAAGREDFRLLMSDIRRLPETQRTALLLREMDALSYEQIAEAMETTVPGVKSLLVRARVALGEAAEARKLTCAEVRLELGAIAEGIARRTPPIRRHVKDCQRCRDFRTHLRANNRVMAAALPIGPLLLLKKIALAKLGFSAGAGGASGGSAAAGAGAGAATAAGGAAAVGRRRRGQRRLRRRRWPPGPWPPRPWPAWPPPPSSPPAPPSRSPSRPPPPPGPARPRRRRPPGAPPDPHRRRLRPPADDDDPARRALGRPPRLPQARSSPSRRPPPPRSSASPPAAPVVLPAPVPAAPAAPAAPPAPTVQQITELLGPPPPAGRPPRAPRRRPRPARPGDRPDHGAGPRRLRSPPRRPPPPPPVLPPAARPGRRPHARHRARPRADRPRPPPTRSCPATRLDARTRPPRPAHVPKRKLRSGTCRTSLAATWSGPGTQGARDRAHGQHDPVARAGEGGQEHHGAAEDPPPAEQEAVGQRVAGVEVDPRLRLRLEHEARRPRAAGRRCSSVANTGRPR